MDFVRQAFIRCFTMLAWFARKKISFYFEKENTRLMRLQLEGILPTDTHVVKTSISYDVSNYSNHVILTLSATDLAFRTKVISCNLKLKSLFFSCSRHCTEKTLYPGSSVLKLDVYDI